MLTYKINYSQSPHQNSNYSRVNKIQNTVEITKIKPSDIWSNLFILRNSICSNIQNMLLQMKQVQEYQQGFCFRRLSILNKTSYVTCTPWSYNCLGTYSQQKQWLIDLVRSFPQNIFGPYTAMTRRVHVSQLKKHIGPTLT